MASVAPSYLLSRALDPVFGIIVGLSSAAIKIQREQREQYPDQDNSFQELWQKGLRNNRVYWGYDENGK